jgi:hypothetical protein
MIALLSQYWYVPAIIVLALAFYVTNRFLKGKAKSIALQYLLAGEKLVFTTTESKLSVIAAVGYSALPPFAKALISPIAFELLVTNTYDEAKSLVDKLHADPSVPVVKK